MKKHIRLLTLAAISLAGFTYGNQLQASSPDNAIFSHFTYTGQDKVYNDNKLSANEFYNPILQGCYPDPSICRKGNECYLLLQRTNNGKSEIVANTPVDMQQPLYLQIQAEGDKYTFNYSTDGHSFKNLGGIVSGDILSTNVAGGFTGNMIGLYATSANMAHPQ